LRIALALAPAAQTTLEAHYSTACMAGW